MSMVSIESILAPWCILERGEVEKAGQLPWPELFIPYNYKAIHGQSYIAYIGTYKAMAMVFGLTNTGGGDSIFVALRCIVLLHGR